MCREMCCLLIVYCQLKQMPCSDHGSAASLISRLLLARPVPLALATITRIHGRTASVTIDDMQFHQQCDCTATMSGYP